MAFRKMAFLFAGLYAFLATWQVWASVDLIMEDMLEVKMGGRAEFRCHCVFSEQPNSTILVWLVENKITGSRQLIYNSNTPDFVGDDTDFAGRIRVSRSQTSGVASGSGPVEDNLLIVEDVRLQDEGGFICQVNADYEGGTEGKTKLRVFAPPETADIEAVHSVISVTSEEPSKIAECEARNSYPKPNITWYRDFTPLQSVQGQVTIRDRDIQESSGLFTVQSELQLKVTKEDKDAAFYCEVNYFVPGGGTNMRESKRINITVHYPPTKVWLRQDSPDGLVKEGDTVAIQCYSDGYPPPGLTFKRENKDNELPSDLGLLILPEVTRADSGTYQCHSLDYTTFDEEMGDIKLQVHHLDHAVMRPKEMDVSQGENMTATCNAQSSLPTHTVWTKDDDWISEGHTLVLQNATFDSAGEYVCVVTVPSLPGLQVTGSTFINVLGAPEIIEPEALVMEESMKKSVNLSCEAWGYPKPIITWSSTGAENWREVSNRATPNGAQSVVTFTLTSDLTAACNATNDMGTNTKLFNIKAIPLTTSGSKVTVAISPHPKKVKKEGNGVIIAVIIICILLLAILGSVLYFLYKKGKLPCGRSGKQDISKEPSSKDDIIMEMKSGKSEEAVLLQGVNGEKKALNDQGEQYMDVQK
ncbi:hypothetical protein SKAU_G00082330 [Synaphobranchus kaupii]|uniref:Ig-like domain-containing protein n=1 Tax=Synaphobranchus kaupii TaxID=118154 RepID=A0A9Q1J3F5_SYNKA|nr:hypothetical protein SKAU_G00082330 [Synaphobranchus kaupii]